MAIPLELDGSDQSGSAGRDLLRFRLSSDNTMATIYVNSPHAARSGLQVWDETHGQYGILKGYSVEADAGGGLTLDGTRVLSDDGYLRLVHGSVGVDPEIALGHSGTDTAIYHDATNHVFRSLAGDTTSVTIQAGALRATDSYWILRRDTGTDVWALYSQTGSLQIYDQANGRDAFGLAQGGLAQFYQGPLLVGSDPGGNNLMRVGGGLTATTSITVLRSGADATLEIRRTGTASGGMTVGSVDYVGTNDAATLKTYARVRGIAESHINLAEYGRLYFYVMANGTEQNMMEVRWDGLYLKYAPTLLFTTVALTNYAGGNTATLTNAPAAGNPTKWIQINDGGVARRIPTW